MVYDFRLPDDRLFAALQVMGRHGGMLQVHCENATIIDALVSGALGAGRIECRHHAACRPTYAEAEATHRAIALAQAADASVYVVHLSCADALAEVVAAKARGWPVYAETCPHYLSRTDAAYDGDDEAEMIKSVISPPLRRESDRQALWLGLARAGLDLVATDHVPDRLAVEKVVPAPPFPQISNGAPGIETLLSVVYSTGVAAGRISVERMVDVLATTRRACSVCRKGAWRSGATPTSCCSTRCLTRDRQATCTTPATSRRTRACRCGAVRPCCCAASRSSVTGCSSAVAARNVPGAQPAARRI